jgi:phage terminase large subunit-like protein
VPFSATKALQDAFVRVRGLLPTEEWRDPLGRAPGESIDPARYSADDLKAMQASLGPRAWSGLWQQNPRVLGGNLIDRNNFTSKTDPNRNRILSETAFEQATEGLVWVRGWDFAYTAQQWNKADPDWTVGVLLAFKIDLDSQTFDIFIKDIVRFRTQWGSTKQSVRDIALRDGIEVYVGGEGNGPQSAALQDIHGMPSLAEYRFVSLPSTYYSVDLSTRAQLWASRAQVGRLWLREAQWNNLFFDEAEGFPNASHDDIVSAVSIAYVLASMVAQGVEPEIEQRQIEFTSRW